MGEPIQLYRADEKVTVYAKSETRRLLAEGWQDSAPVVEMPPVVEEPAEPTEETVPPTKRVPSRRRKG